MRKKRQLHAARRERSLLAALLWFAPVSAAALVFFAPISAAAQCRPASAAEASAAATWSVRVDDVAVGQCGSHGEWCFVIAGTVCETGLQATEVVASTMNVAAGRVLVLRWVSRAARDVYLFRDATGTEVWRIDVAPSRVLAILERLTERDANPVQSEVRFLCATGRTVEITPVHAVLGARTADARCRHLPASDRRGSASLGPGARTLTWEELLAPGH